MKRIIALVLAALAIMLAGTWNQVAHAKSPEDAPQTAVSAFYTWYIKLNASSTYPLLDRRIYDFVSKGTVDKLRDDYKHDRLPGDSDYFLKVQDEDDKDWLAHMETHTPLMLGDVAVVPVTFGSKDKISVLVFLRKHEGHWKIIKVDDTLAYN